MDFAKGGELFFLLREKGQLNENVVKFYAAQIILAIEHLHQLGVVYRDLKPENILLDEEGNILLTDFGLSKMVIQTNSFCGTPDYIPPEIIKKLDYDKNVDWWQLGALIYELLVGHTPFFNHDVKKMFHNIINKPVKKNLYLSNDAFDLISKLLIKDSNNRLGSSEQDSLEIKNHSFFNNIDWEAILEKKIKPPINLKNKSLGYFDKTSLVNIFILLFKF